MTCVWTLGGLSHFGGTWSRALGLPHLVSVPTTDETVIIVGWHKPAKCNQMTASASKRIIVWCGNDAARFAQPATIRESDIHLTANAELIPMLAKWGIQAEVCWFPTSLHPSPTHLPEEPHIIMYGGLAPEAYGLQVFEALRDLPARFTVWKYGERTDAELTALIEDSTVIVQAGNLHGGLVVREAAEAGRVAISTYDLPYIERVAPGDTEACRRIVMQSFERSAPDYQAAKYWQRENSESAFVERVGRYL